ncbi:TetR/AcrR family transcriptional regulator [Amycolatopsis sp. BJA-103]|uniref:TetR/AcrR family transcriptional regulator n=1 Tax=Amycolatopsis sp. BJA-103 TaxID=1911175 RepID=UPI000C78C984|nr:TetR/AcrR family transcriptional regulator [Amycolatopsis sp. BJA-103]AUI61233.1 TetR family transcriptional regulator [Amycolatopsis sp. BJA-103]PNE21478.1 TetR family transcriptional regulator [Amycolatopsis sp. BJA-103]
MAATTTRRSAARDRLLETASKIFYTQGIHSVPVDDVIVAAEVSRATFYRHFPGKEDLVRAYLEAEHDRIRGLVAAATEQKPEPSKMLEILVLGIGEEICAPGFRGCPFINAAAEYPDPEHPVRRVVREHRTWFRDSIAEIVGATGHPDPAAAARELTFLRDGAMVGGYLEDADEVRESLAHAARAVLSAGVPQLES